MSDTLMKKYKPISHSILSFGTPTHECNIRLHPNSRWYAYRHLSGFWRVSGSKISLYLTDEEFRKDFELVGEA